MIKSLVRRFALLAGAAAAAVAFTPRMALSNGAYFFDFSEPRTVHVHCGYNTIGDALQGFPLRPLVIVVKGTCLEDVSIERNRVTLAADTPGVDGVLGQNDGGAAIRIAGSQNVVLDGIRVRSAAGSSAAGVLVTANGEATIRNVQIDESGYGIWANHGAFLLLEASEISNARSYGLLLTDAASARIENSVVEIANSDFGSSAAIGAFRSINIRLHGDNRIVNGGDDKIPGNDDDGFSMDLFHSVELRQGDGHSVFVGRVELGNLSHASLRDPEILGGIDLFGGSRADIRKSSTGPNEVTGGRRLGIFGNSQLELRSGAHVEVESIEVSEHSTFDVGRTVDVNVAGDANFHASTVALGDDASVTVAGSVFVGHTRIEMAPNAHMSVGGHLSAFDRTGLSISGPASRLEVSGTMDVNAFVTVNVGPESSLMVANGLQISDFSLMFAGDRASIVTDMDFGGSVTKVNFAGDGVMYTGDMSFSPMSSMTFGPNNEVDGSIDCNGGQFFAVTPLTLTGGSTIVNCP